MGGVPSPRAPSRGCSRRLPTPTSVPAPGQAPAAPRLGGPHSPRRGRGSKADAKRQSRIHAMTRAECPAASQLKLRAGPALAPASPKYPPPR